MPIYEVVCLSCEAQSELLVMSGNDEMICPACGGSNVRKLMAATSSMTGRTGPSLPGPGDTACCGSTPGHAGCAGPGSCCGKGPI
ncbi:MAG: zinc ribbon domain-containing protein [Desulfobacterales bacterium]|nr:zinc ribbon domain-containing protein [Desulfobacterales bacterium]